MQDVFQNTGNCNNPDLNLWDTSKVTIMKNMFAGSEFNGDISAWDVSSVGNFYGTFYNSQFNGDISSWVVSSGTEFSYIFAWNLVFNHDISPWDVRVERVHDVVSTVLTWASFHLL